MSGMTVIDSSGNIHAEDGKFAGHIHRPADISLLFPNHPKTPFTVAPRIQLEHDGGVTLPKAVPAGGVVSASLEDNGNVMVSLAWEAGALAEEDVTISFGVTSDYDRWSTFDWEDGAEEHFTDEQREAVLDYLGSLQRHVNDNAQKLQWAAVEGEALDTFVKLATGQDLHARPIDPDTEEPVTASEDWAERAAVRGSKIVDGFTDPDDEDDTRAADAIADILEWARARGIDPEHIMQKAASYLDED